MVYQYGKKNCIPKNKLMTSKAYSNWMVNQDRIKVLIKFYPWAVKEMHDAWPETGHYDEVFPHCTLHEAVYKLDSTLKPILSFGIVQLASLFESYLGDRYAEIIEERILSVPLTELKLADEYRIRIEEFGSEAVSYIAQEKENFMQERTWKKRLGKLLEQLGREIPEAADLLPVTEIMEVRNLLVHHSGKATKRFLEKFPESEYVSNNVVDIGENVINKMVLELQDFVYYRIESSQI